MGTPLTPYLTPPIHRSMVEERHKELLAEGTDRWSGGGAQGGRATRSWSSLGVIREKNLWRKSAIHVKGGCILDFYLFRCGCLTEVGKCDFYFGAHLCN